MCPVYTGKSIIMKFLGKIKGLMFTGFSPFWRTYLKLRGVSIGSGFTCIGMPKLNITRKSHIHIMDNVTLCNTGMANPVANLGPCRLATVAKGANIILHNHVGLSSCLIAAANSIEILENTIIGGGTMIIDTDFHYRKMDGSWGTDAFKVSKPVRIGRNCFIGARCIILKGVTIGDNCVIGAGSVVANHIPSGHLAAGNPAKIIRKV